MSKLDELIRGLCPDGVEYKTLGEIAVDIYRGAGITRDQVTAEGTPCVRYGEIYTTYGVWFDKCVSHTDESKLLSKKYFEHGDILFAITGESVDDIAKCCAYMGHEKCLAGGDIVVLKHNQNPKYLSYALATTDARQQKSKGKVKSKVVHSSVPAIREIKVPVPPIEIQREIVRILDNFTNLTAELTAELTARKTQYAYYRDNLLTTKPQWNHVKILDMLSQPITDGPHTTPQFVQNGVPFISVDSIWDGKIHFEKRRGYITEEFDEECCKKYKPQKNDVYMVKSGSTTGKVAFVDTDIRFNIWSPLAAMRVNEKNSARFLFYLLQTERVQKQVKAKSSHGSQPNLGMRELEQFEVDIPPLDVQNRIVNVLDNFEKICSDLNIGLPAEIEARQKQYEYYRDKLLTFAEDGNTILSRAEQSRAEQSRAEQSRAEQSRALIKLLQYVFGYAVVSLQDVVKNSCSGGTPKKGVSEYYEGGNIPWLRTQEVVFRDIYKTECFITESAVKNSAAKWIPENCVIVAISGATAGRCAINKIPLTTNQHCLNLEVDPEMALYRYVYYCICAKQEELLAKKEGARGDLNSTRILSLQIDLPALEEQKRIVSILDRFDTICNDLTSGLPAEIEARQKQYEYYRDKLLTFEERG